MLRHLLIIFAVVLGLAGEGPASAQTAGNNDRLRIMAAQDIQAGATTQTFDLSKTQGKIKAVRLIAGSGNSGSMTIERVIVTYANGQVHYEDREKPINLRPGERTAEIDPRDEERFIDKVEVIMKPGAEAIRLELWVMQSPEGRVATRPSGARSRTILRTPDAATTPAPAKPEAKQIPLPDDRDRPKSVDLGAAKPFTEVDVYYGTNRKAEADRRQDGRTLASYGTRPDRVLALGRAVVTVPTQGREKGQLNRPQWDLVIASFSLRGQNAALDFTLLGVEQMKRDDFIREARAQLGKAVAFPGHAFVFVHGYNVSFDDALFRAAQIKHDMEFDGLPLVYSWPSLGGVRGYFLDQRRARDARDTMREFLDMVSADTGATQIHLIAHSMGANPIMEALQGYSPVPAAGAEVIVSGAVEEVDGDRLRAGRITDRRFRSD